MKRMVLQMVVVFLATGALAVNTAELVSDEHAQAILDKKCIRLGTSEILPISFDTAVTVFNRTNLVAAAQAEFGRSIAQDEEAIVPVTRDAPGKYHYVDHKKRRVEITELYREQTDEHSFDYIALATKERFLGGYDVIIHLRVIDAGDAGLVYCVITHAYPHNWVTRASARDINLTKRHYKNKMRTLSWVAREIALELCEAEEFRRELRDGPARSEGAQLPSTLHR